MPIPSFRTMYHELIAIPSVSARDHTTESSNLGVVEKIADWCDTLGFTTTVIPLPNSPNKYNLLASIGHGTGGLLLSGHSDTVPFEPGSWQWDPFKLTERDNRLYGLGTADMKGFFAFILDSLRHSDLRKLKKPLHILVTADEETSMLGAVHFSATTSIRPDCIIIGEPTSLIPIRAHKGHITSHIKILGRSGHSSDPSTGLNAIEIMAKVITQVSLLKNKLQQLYHNPAFSVSYPTLNLGQIQGGDAANRICGCCELVIDIRPLPGMNFEDVYQLLLVSLCPIMQRWPNQVVIQFPHPPIPSYECQANNNQLSIIEQLAGHQAQTANYCTEASYLNTVAPTIVLGPGSINQAHQPNEYLSVNMIKPTLRLLNQLRNHFCHA